MKIMILGADGYLGWVNLMHFVRDGHEVIGIDNKSKRQLMQNRGVTPLEVEQDIDNKLALLQKYTGQKVEFYINDITNDKILRQAIEKHQPDVILHFAEQPSAPYSMIDEHTACSTIFNNYMSTLRLIYAVRDINPDIHIIKLGTMGEYGTPNIDIEEGWINITHNGRKDTMLFPKSPHSMYHLSKVNDSDALAFACKMWGLRVTDLNQGFVYGMHTHEVEHTGLYSRFCYDHIFGTVLNRFIVQAALHYPLTVYGSGEQQRPMINIRDSVQCVDLAVNNPANPGEFRVFNQFTEVKSIIEIAKSIANQTQCTINRIDNPRIEAQQHYYNPVNSALLQLGLEPSLFDDITIVNMLDWVVARSELIDVGQIKPTIDWAVTSQ